MLEDFGFAAVVDELRVEIAPDGAGDFGVGLLVADEVVNGADEGGIFLVVGESVEFEEGHRGLGGGGSGCGGFGVGLGAGGEGEGEEEKRERGEEESEGAAVGASLGGGGAWHV